MINLNELKGYDENIIPNNKNMGEVRRHYNIYGHDRYIVATRHENEVIDGFAMIRFLKKIGIEEVHESEVCRRNRREDKLRRKYTAINEPYANCKTTYVYGYAIGINQELVWRIPHDWRKLTSELKKGDVVVCNVLNGERAVQVTRVEELDKKPIDICVKIVCKNMLVRNGEEIYFD